MSEVKSGPRVLDAEMRRVVEALIDDMTPKVCVYCDGTGWVEDEGWSYYPWGRGPARERVEDDGLLVCGGCRGGDEMDRDERTEPSTLILGWSFEQEQTAARLLATYVLGDGVPEPILWDGSDEALAAISAALVEHVGPTINASAGAYNGSCAVSNWDTGAELGFIPLGGRVQIAAASFVILPPSEVNVDE